MNTDIALYSEKRTIGYSDCDKRGLAKLSILAAFLQDMAMRHDLLINKELFGHDEIKHHYALLRTNFKMIQMPQWRDEITATTWLHPLEHESRFLYRSFIFYNERGEEIGYLTLTAFYIDLVERKAKALPEEVKQFPTLERELCTNTYSRIKRPKNGVTEIRAMVFPTDIDMYNHVNNNRYLCWAIDHTPVEIQDNYYCISSEFQFRMELQQGQEFISKTEVQEGGDEIVLTHQIVRVSDATEISRLLTTWKKR